ncbi:MAG: hypothetical protein ABR578_01965 [Chromatocurvus sp.]
MAEETNTTNSATADEAKATPKRKTTARKTTARKTQARSTAAGKTAENKTTARKTAASKKVASKTATSKTTAKRKTGPRKASARKASPDITARARDASRSAFLASLGFYGKAFDQVQDQFNTVQSQLESRRKKADKVYAALVKRGEKVEKQALSAIDDIDLSRLEFTSITDRKELEARLGKVRRRFSDLRESVRFNSAA